MADHYIHLPLPLRTRPDIVEPAWVENPPEAIGEVCILLEAESERLTEDSAAGKVLRSLFYRIKEKYDDALLTAKRLYPIAFFKPSYEQALMLNVWIWGINFPICFASNRIGKTVALGVINAMLWLFPNNPSWLMFRPYIDFKGRLVAVIPRPRLSSIIRLQHYLTQNPHLVGEFTKQPYEQPNLPKFRFLQQQFANLQLFPVYPEPPVTKSGSIWLGAPDLDWHRQIFMKRWSDWLPANSKKKWNVTECYFELEISYETDQKHTNTFFVDCKSYDSEHTKWSGDAVQGIMLTEGFTKDILDEVKQRIINDGFMSWDYTPAEPRNTGKKVKLAYDVYKGSEQLPLRTHIFTKFSVRNAPDHIIPREKKADLLRMWDGKPEGKARIDGDFYASSGAVLDKLDRSFHCLDWTLQELFTRFPNGRFCRGIDPGLDHPTSCAWGYLTRNNLWFIYRFYSERGKTIPERCADIITLSNNSRQKFTTKNGSVYWREIHDKPTSEVFTKSMIDYHIFKEDENTGQAYSQNYIKEGLIVSESTHMKPEMRGQTLNGMLDPKAFPYHAHPERGVPPGARIFFLTSQPGVAKAVDQLEEVFWSRYVSGDNVGEPKDQVQIHGDDELDATCYLACDPIVWTPYEPKRRLREESEPEILLMAPAY